MRRRTASLGLALIALQACSQGDPGWTYRDWHGEDHQSAGGLKADVTASVFGGTLTLTVAVKNTSSKHVTVDPARIVVTDAGGRTLEPREAFRVAVDCNGQSASGGCLIRMNEFAAATLRLKVQARRFLNARNPDLKSLGVSIKTLRSGGKEGRLDAQLLWE